MMYTYQQRMYAKRLYKLRQAYIVKDNIHLTYKYKNRNKAFHNIDTMQDRINKAIIEDKVNGNGAHPKNLKKHGQEIIHTTITNERKRIHHDKHNKSVNHATKNNSEIFTDIFNYRRQKICESLEDKIDKELKRPKYSDLSDSEKISKLRNDYQDYGKKRLKNIIKDAMHTNESNIAFINAIEKGYNYKIWMNGRSKGKTRPWHKAKHIASVPIDETFDIYGSYPARMMYPGDLNGGAENVANCKCWLNYTNRVPRTLRKKSTFKINPNFQKLVNKTSKIKRVVETIVNPIHKLLGNMNDWYKYNPKIMGYNIPKKYKQLKGKTLTGMLPNHEQITTYFTKDVTKTLKYDKIIDEWTNTPFDKKMRIFANVGFNINTLRTELLNDSKIPNNLIPKYIEEAKEGLKEMEELMKNSVLKKDLVLYRQQENLYLGRSPKVGKIIEWDSYNATSISKEGLNHYDSFVNMDKWNFTILAPKGTRGAYISPKAGAKYAPEMEFILDRHTKLEILDINQNTKQVLVKVIV